MHWSVCDLLTDRNGSCDFTQCGDGRCCCSTVIKPILGETINVVVWRGGKRVTSKDITITDSSKLTSLKFVIYSVSKLYMKPWSVNIKEIWWSTLDFFFCPSSLDSQTQSPTNPFSTTIQCELSSQMAIKHGECCHGGWLLGSGGHVLQKRRHEEGRCCALVNAVSWKMCTFLSFNFLLLIPGF